MRRAWVAAAVLTALACENSKLCTLIGCLNNLTIEIQNPPDGPMTARAFGAVNLGDGGPDFRCAPSSCLLFYSGDVPERVDVTITTPTGTRTFTVTPRITTSRPNGPNCAPVCQSGIATVTWQ